MSSVIAEPTEGHTRKVTHKNQNVWCQADVTVNADAQCCQNTVAALKPRTTQETYRYCNTESLCECTKTKREVLTHPNPEQGRFRQSAYTSQIACTRGIA